MRRAAGRMGGLRIRRGLALFFVGVRQASPLRTGKSTTSRRVLGGAFATLLCANAPAWAAPAAAPARPAEGPLSLSLPEVLIESPDLERLIARRVRPAPPERLGVRLPDLLIEGEVPPLAIPSLPLPA